MQIFTIHPSNFYHFLVVYFNFTSLLAWTYYIYYDIIKKIKKCMILISVDTFEIFIALLILGEKSS